MLFSLEALDADHGDALLLHYGTVNNPEFVVIDGGPSDVYELSIKPRIEEIAAIRGVQTPLPARLVMVSHIDADHITGVLDMLQDQNSPVQVGALWHNSFDDIVGNAAALEDLGDQDEAAAANFGTDAWTMALAAGVAQGRKLRKLAIQQGLQVNAGVKGWWVDSGDEADLGRGLKLTIVGPRRSEIKDLREKWDATLASLPGLSPDARRAKVAAFTDKSAANLASIVAMAEKGGKTMLLTGDARGDIIKKGLSSAGLLKNGKLHVDLLKVPHHGSDRNVTQGFFNEITADHYVFSGNDKHDNPEIETLEMLTKARGAARYAMHFTYRLPKLVSFFQNDQANNNRKYTVHYRAADYYSVWVDLGNEALTF